MAEHPLDAVALTVKPLAVADRLGAVQFRRDDGANAALFEVVADRIGIIRLVGDEGAWRLAGAATTAAWGWATRELLPPVGIRTPSSGAGEMTSTAFGRTQTMLARWRTCSHLFRPN